MDKKKIYDYLILSARVLLAWTFLSYGWGKLTGGQFGLSPDQLNKPIKELGLFRLSWYLFDQEPFRSFIGISQIIAGLMLLYNRTLLVGALISLPILTNILIIDITYIKMTGFYWRLSYYLILDLLILWYYRDRMFLALKNIIDGVSTKFKYPVWMYIILPLMAVVLEFLGIIPKLITMFIINPSDTLNELGKIPGWVMEMIKKIFG